MQAALRARDLAGVGVPVAPERRLGAMRAGARVRDGQQQQRLAVERLADRLELGVPRVLLRPRLHQRADLRVVVVVPRPVHRAAGGMGGRQCGSVRSVAQAAAHGTRASSPWLRALAQSTQHCSEGTLVRLPPSSIGGRRADV